MSNFDDLNNALTELRQQMDNASTIAEAFSYLEAAAEAVQSKASEVEAKLLACEKRITGVEQELIGFRDSVKTLTAKTTQAWKDITIEVLDEHSKIYVDRVSLETAKACGDFLKQMNELRTKWAQIDASFNKLKKINLALIIAMAVILAIGLLSFLKHGMN